MPTVKEAQRQVFINTMIDLAQRDEGSLAIDLALDKDLKTETFPDFNIETCIPTSWFKETGKAFFSGLARHCMTSAVIHPEIGMGTSHYQSFGIDDSRWFLGQLFDLNDPQRASEEYLRAQDPDTFMIDYYPFSRKRDKAVDVVNRAIAQFRKLGVNEVPASTTIALIGAEYLASDPAQRNSLHAAVERHLQGKLGRKLTSALKLEFALGQVGGIAYGESNHPYFPEPGFFDFFLFHPFSKKGSEPISILWQLATQKVLFPNGRNG